jgi:hypothetical protein
MPFCGQRIFLLFDKLLLPLSLCVQHGTPLTPLLIVQQTTCLSVLPASAVEEACDERYEVNTHHNSDGDADWRSPTETVRWL